MPRRRLPRRQAARANLPASDPLRAAQRLVYLKLMEKYQEFNPFKFILYAGQIDQATAQMGGARNVPALGGR